MYIYVYIHTYIDCSCKGFISQDLVYFGRNQTYLEKDVPQWVGSTDPIPMTMHITFTV